MFQLDPGTTPIYTAFAFIKDITHGEVLEFNTALFPSDQFLNTWLFNIILLDNVWTRTRVVSFYTAS